MTEPWWSGERKSAVTAAPTPKHPEKVSEGITLLQFLDDLSKSEQRAALIHLSLKWAEQQEEDSHA